MPSRKKAQGKARKAKQAAEVSNGYVQNSVRAFCNHLGELNWSRSNDWDKANNLYGEFLFQRRLLLATVDRERAEGYATKLFKLVNQIYDKYRQFDDKLNGAREMFKTIVLGAGTELCTRFESDLVEFKSAFSCMIMVQTIEVRDKNEGGIDENTMLFEIEIPLVDIMECP
eukprot:scaffold358340_cov126-Cyclotella_meneghiniana.AAC.1